MMQYDSCKKDFSVQYKLKSYINLYVGNASDWLNYGGGHQKNCGCTSHWYCREARHSRHTVCVKRYHLLGGSPGQDRAPCLHRLHLR